MAHKPTCSCEKTCTRVGVALLSDGGVAVVSESCVVRIIVGFTPDRARVFARGILSTADQADAILRQKKAALS